MSKSCSRAGGSTILMLLRLQISRMFGTFPRLLFSCFLGGAFLLGRGFLWSLLAIFLLIWSCHGVPLGRSFASMLSLLCLLVPVRTSWSASARESFPHGHKTGSRFLQFGTLFVRFVVFCCTLAVETLTQKPPR